MRIKELFTVPTGQKITDKYFYRILTVSICGILLCMSCLAGSTWAWFVAGIENQGNEIVIATPEIDLTVAGSAYTPGTEVTDAVVALNMTHGNEADDFDKKSTLYVTLTLQCGSQVVTGYTTLNESNGYSATLNVENNTSDSCTINWQVSWFAPVGAAPFTESTVTFAAASQPFPAETTEATTAPSTEGAVGA